MNLKGKVIQILKEETGMGKKGQWRKQEFVVETAGQYPKKVCMSVWGDKIDQFSLRTGDVLDVSIELESREYSGRWYTEVRAWKIVIAGEPASTPIPKQKENNTQASSQDDLPF